MTCADFELSAEVSAPAVAQPGASVGARIYKAIAATKAAVGQNTNLGIVLLCAPLATAADRGEPLQQILDTLSIDDTQKCFDAICVANPGGLGLAPIHDVRSAATTPLREAMAAATERDLVARQYANGFADIVGLGLSQWREARARGRSPSEAATAVYLAFLQTRPDTHIARKFGRETAERLRQEVAERVPALPVTEVSRRAFLLEWDSDLKARGLNPGACADLTVATLFAAILAERTPNILRPLPNSG